MKILMISQEALWIDNEITTAKLKVKKWSFQKYQIENCHLTEDLEGGQMHYGQKEIQAAFPDPAFKRWGTDLAIFYPMTKLTDAAKVSGTPIKQKRRNSIPAVRHPISCLFGYCSTWLSVECFNYVICMDCEDKVNYLIFNKLSGI